jgi:hypothetical protein
MYVQRYSILIWLATVCPNWRFPGFLHFIKQIHMDSTLYCTCGFTICSHIISLCVQPKIQQIMVRRFCRPLDWASTSCPLLTKSLVQVLSDYKGTPKAFGLFRPDQWLRGVTAMSSHACWQVRIKSGIFLSTHFMKKHLKVVMICMGALQSIYARDNMKIIHTSTVIGFFLHMMTGTFLPS